MVRVILTYNGLISAERQRCATQLPVWRAGIIAVQVCLASEFAASRVAGTLFPMSMFPSKPEQLAGCSQSESDWLHPKTNRDWECCELLSMG